MLVSYVQSLYLSACSTAYLHAQACFPIQCGHSSPATSRLCRPPVIDGGPGHMPRVRSPILVLTPPRVTHALDTARGGGRRHRHASPPPPMGPTYPPAPTVTTRQARGSPRGAPTNQQLPPLPPPRVVMGVGGGGTGAGGRLRPSWQRVGRRRAAAGSHPTAAPLKGNGGVYGRQRARRRRPSSRPLPAAVRDPHRLVWARMFVLQSPVTTRHRPHTLRSSLTPATR